MEGVSDEPPADDQEALDQYYGPQDGRDGYGYLVCLKGINQLP